MNKTIKSILLSAIVLTQVATPVMANVAEESVYAGVRTNFAAIVYNLKDAAVNTAQVTTNRLIGWMPSVLKQLTDEARDLTGAMKTCPTITLVITGFVTYTAYKFFYKNNKGKKRRFNVKGWFSRPRQPVEEEEYYSDEE